MVFNPFVASGMGFVYVTPAEYQEYLQSPGWRMTRWLRKADRCAECWSIYRLELHHVSYRWHNSWKIAKWFIPNLWDEMKTLCNSCHNKEHGFKG